MFDGVPKNVQHPRSMSNTIDLHYSLSSTLELFVRSKRKRAREVSEELLIEPSVAHARLEKLRRKGLLDREHKGHGWLYFKVSK